MDELEDIKKINKKTVKKITRLRSSVYKILTEIMEDRLNNKRIKILLKDIITDLNYFHIDCDKIDEILYNIGHNYKIDKITYNLSKKL